MVKSRSEGILNVIAYVFVGIMVVFTLYPVAYTILGSLKTNQELTLGESIFPKTWQFKNYSAAFIQADFTRYTLTSLMVSLSAMIIGTITASMAGFIFSRRRFIGKKLLLALYVSMMFVALGSVTLYPMYFLLSFFGLTKSFIGLILALTGGQAANVLLVMGFTNSIPRELDEAATIDGCTIYGIFVRIIFPLLKPILAVVALFTFRNSWNEYIIPFILSIANKNLKTLTVAVVQLKYAAQAAAEWHIMLAGASIAIIPILIVYLFANKQFISGLTAGAVKG
ncbi:MAG: carbohydrate ABC transporter permease [Spirochaetaceae bacterium]|jgi:ABC-type glycerol-3-phosphate transport system permease component|nr:carbohydrate ABC transporter permease [Spirochaetaceae bacterium]